MASISSLGRSSGLDRGSLIGKIVAEERAPAENRFNRKEVGLQTKLSAFGSLKSAASNAERGIEDIEQRYVKQLSALDTLLAHLQNTRAILTRQLSGISI